MDSRVRNYVHNCPQSESTSACYSASLYNLVAGSSSSVVHSFDLGLVSPPFVFAGLCLVLAGLLAAPLRWLAYHDHHLSSLEANPIVTTTTAVPEPSNIVGVMSGQANLAGTAKDTEKIAVTQLNIRQKYDEEKKQSMGMFGRIEMHEQAEAELEDRGISDILRDKSKDSLTHAPRTSRISKWLSGPNSLVTTAANALPTAAETTVAAVATTFDKAATSDIETGYHDRSIQSKESFSTDSTNQDSGGEEDNDAEEDGSSVDSDDNVSTNSSTNNSDEEEDDDGASLNNSSGSVRRWHPVIEPGHSLNTGSESISVSESKLITIHLYSLIYNLILMLHVIVLPKLVISLPLHFSS
ncbi:unnamed protein product [Protopolystoma xenopodis]|uniref:Uncharacterized protein n=1 Tax=Protopolystoma xenopodis TaxID=117903 RepID=A0A448WLU7_9PLAT|nr:unnamed protein product [Protopolystoma xenopodis]